MEQSPKSLGTSGTMGTTLIPTPKAPLPVPESRFPPSQTVPPSSLSLSDTRVRVRTPVLTHGSTAQAP